MKKVLITGGAGFIGANLVRRLVSEAGFTVFVIEKEGTNLWRLKGIIDKITVHYVNLEDQKKLFKIVNGMKPDVVIHLAGYGGYPASQNDVMKMIDINIRGTLNLIHSLKNCSSTSFVNIGSSSEYKEKKSRINEEDITDPANFYAITKLTTELLLKKIAQENNIPIINLRLFNVYGYYGNSEGLIPYIILNGLKSKKVKLHSPNNVRDFIFIEDVMDIFLKIIKRRHHYKGEIFNIGSGKQYSIKGVANTIEKLLGKRIHVSYVKKSNYYRETKFFQADNRKAQKTFSWKINYDFESGIIKTIDWFKKNQELYHNQ